MKIKFYKLNSAGPGSGHTRLLCSHSQAAMGNPVFKIQKQMPEKRGPLKCVALFIF